MLLPVFHGANMIGVVGVANCPVGYGARLAEFLQPLVTTCGTLIDACSNERRKRLADTERQKFFFLVENSSDCIGMATLDGRLMDALVAGPPSPPDAGHNPRPGAPTNWLAIVRIVPPPTSRTVQP